MHTAGHQHIGMHQAACLARIFGQPVKIEVAILLAEKTGLPIVAALDDVQGSIR